MFRWLSTLHSFIFIAAEFMVLSLMTIRSYLFCNEVWFLLSVRQIPGRHLANKFVCTVGFLLMLFEIYLDHVRA